MARITLGTIAAGLALISTLGCGSAEPASLTLAETSLAVRPSTPGNNLQFGFDAGDVVETHASSKDRFLVHFTRSGPNAVPATDGDTSGVPDFVEEVAEIYERVLDHYQGTLGFRLPVSDASIADNGGDGRFDVYLVDFAGFGDGHFSQDSCSASGGQICAGYMVQENDYAGYGYPNTNVANRILASHEFFHAVQASYDTDQGSVMSEGSAVWATESFDPTLTDFEAFLKGYLDNPDRSLDVPLPGPVDPFSYASALFFQFLEERYGAGTVRSLWERCENGNSGQADPYWLSVLDPLLTEKHQTTFPDAFVDFATWNLFTQAYADPSRSYLEGKRYPRVAMQSVAAPFSDEKLRVFYASTQYFSVDPAGRSNMTAALVGPPADPTASDGLALLLATRSGVQTSPVLRVSDLAAGLESVDTSGADELVVVVVNGQSSGESRRPGLCIGDPTEVDACRATLLGGGGSGGAAGAGSGGSPAASSDDSGCGCRQPVAPARAPAAFGVIAGLLLLSARRRRAVAD
jgi:hypothetical protein